MKKVVLGMMLCVLAGCQESKVESFDVDRELDYCASQVSKALDALCRYDGTYDYTMEPRNILEGDTVWNCCKASAEEWCSGFWPGILWMMLESDVTGVPLDTEGLQEFASAMPLDSLRKIAEGYTASLNFLAERPAYDHDLGFLVINSFLKGYEATGNEEYKRIALAAADTLATLFNLIVRWAPSSHGLATSRTMVVTTPSWTT